MLSPAVADSAVIEVKVVPGASKRGVTGWHGSALKVRLQSPPVDGRANEELIQFLSKQLDAPRRALSIVSGHTSRLKRIRIEGFTKDQVIERLAPNP